MPSSSFNIGKIAFAEADYMFLAGNALIFVGIALVAYFSIFKKTEAKGTKSTPKKGKNVEVETPGGRRSSRLQAKVILTLCHFKFMVFVSISYIGLFSLSVLIPIFFRYIFHLLRAPHQRRRTN